MHGLATLDDRLFRFVNLSLSNSVLDQLMPVLASNVLVILGTLIVLYAIWKGGRRGIVFAVLLLLSLSLSDWISNTIKNAVARPRPFLAMAGINVLIGRGGSFSMPSAHAANCFAIAMVCFVYYRRSLWFVLPVAFLTAFSRVYNGVHYPSDVLAGALLGAGAAAALLWGLENVWQWAGPKWFPLWWQRWNSLLVPELKPKAEAALRAEAKTPDMNSHWLHLGYVAIGITLIARLCYLASDVIELTGDEAYQWLWSKHLALAYYSKPPLIAYTQFLGTSLWGDNAFGVRFFSPVIGAALSWMLLRFLTREVNGRAGFFLVLISSATPLLGAGAILMTVDPLSVLFWTAAMLSGWRAIQPEAKTSLWAWTGLWMGLGLLSKYTALLQWVCWAVFFMLWPPARKHLRRPGPYVALLINLLCAVPVVIWNAQHQWVTASHLASNAQLGAAAKSLGRHLLDSLEFIGAELGLLNPIFFVAALIAHIAFWRQDRRNPLLLFIFSMGAPLFLSYFLWSFHSRILPNWIAPSVLPIFCLMVAFWEPRWQLKRVPVRAWLVAGLTLGWILVAFGHETDLVRKFTGRPLPAKIDPLRRARGWQETARVVGEARQRLLADEQKPVFIITTHYTYAGQISFYLPEARERVRDEPFVYCRTSTTPRNQLFFWPGYTGRKGQNAIFVQEIDPKKIKGTPPPQLEAEFESVIPLERRDIKRHGQVFRSLQLYACKNLR
jgi:4-amino-4-deoxy-L-arabinose transferase-like glycosyltransferase/membrane-associated phospholipid phosphatase